jgi:hypothetical protein
MGLGPTLVGGIIGAAVGMGLHLLVEITTGHEAPWFAIIIGLITGLGVHQANKSLAGRVSYLRGAVAAAIALAAIVGSTPLISMIARNREATLVSTNPEAASNDDDDDAEDDADAADADAEEAPAVEERAAVAGDAGTVGRLGRGPAPFNVWQFVYMAVGTFIAYEFGRGSAPHRPAPPAGDVSDEPPVMTDPSN